VKTEADSNDINQYSHDDKPTIGMYLFIIYYKVYTNTMSITMTLENRKCGKVVCHCMKA